MEWWNEFQAWFNSTAGSRIFLNAILPFVAIVLAGVIAALIGRGSARRVVEQQDRQHTGAAIIALIVVGRKAAIWSSLGADEKQHIDSLMSEADIRVRLLPVNGSNLAADWAAHELSAMKKNSASFSFQAEQTLVEYRDRLLNWQAKPRRAKKLFGSDLDQWRYEEADQSTVVAQQQQWAKEHVEPAAAAPATATTTAVAAAPATPAPTTAAIASPAAPVTSPVTTPGLANAAPPTTAPMDAPAPTSAPTPTSVPTPPSAPTATEAAIARSKNVPTGEVPTGEDSAE